MIDNELIKEALEIINIIEDSGYEAYIVGGSLRDSLLGMQPKDIDIASSASPTEIKLIFNSYKTIDTGIDFGTVTLIYNDKPVEITTFRSESVYLDSRRPDSVSFEKNVDEDLKRRDFTINAMAYNQSKKLVDLFSGEEDLNNKLIRCVGSPDERFSEDALRMLRAVRFACVLNFDIEKNTFEAIKYNASRIEHISKERIQAELNKILMSSKPSRGIRLLLDSKLLDYVLPEISRLSGFNQHNPFHHLELLEHTLCVLDKVEPRLQLRLAALFHDVGKVDTVTLDENGIGHFYGHDSVSEEITKSVLKRLRYSNEIIELTSQLVRYHMIQANVIGKKGIQKLLRIFGENNIFELADLHFADSSCTTMEVKEDVFRLKIRQVLDENIPFSVKDLDIDGYDLMKIGAKGKQIGDILNELLELVSEDASKNNKNQLMLYAKEIYSNLE